MNHRSLDPQTHTRPQTLPLIALQKHKKYNRPHYNQQNPLKHDIDHIILHLAPHPTCQHKLKLQQQAHLKHKISQSTQKLGISIASPPISTKSLKLQISKYIQKMGSPLQNGEGDYAQFVRLSRQSQDYLEYYIKNHFKLPETIQQLQCADQSVILSLLKSNYPCLTDNPPEITNRILLSLAVNPLNDFHFIPWHTFSKFRKLATLRLSKAQMRKFLVDYIMASNREISREEFWAIVGTVVRKLERVINASNVERLIERIVSSCEWLPERLKGEELYELIIVRWQFLWEQMARLIFIV